MRSRPSVFRTHGGFIAWNINNGLLTGESECTRTHLEHPDLTGVSILFQRRRHFGLEINGGRVWPTASRQRVKWRFAAAPREARFVTAIITR